MTETTGERLVRKFLVCDGNVPDGFAAAIDAAIADERERCAALCDAIRDQPTTGHPYAEGNRNGAARCAVAIRKER